MRIMNRIATATATAAVLVACVAGVASAGGGTTTTGPTLTSKTIDTEAGSCGANGGTNCNSAALYGANGFSGTLTFNGSGTVTAWDYICTNTPSNSAFKTFAGTYTFKVYDGSTLLGSTSYAVAGGQACTGSTNWAAGGTGLTFTVPASKTVGYTISIAGITAGASAQAAFAGSATIQNQAFNICNTQALSSVVLNGGVVSSCSCSGVARSWAVPPPTNFIIPEAPYAILLPLTAGLFAAAFVMRRSRSSVAGVAI
jgi:hypothetical protein